MSTVDVVKDIKGNKFNSCTLNFTTFLVFWTFVCNSFDHGALPAVIEHFKKDYNMTTIQMGSLGTAIYIGPIFGSLVASFIIDKLPYKLTFFVNTLLIAVAFFSLRLTSNYGLLMAARFLSGFGQGFLNIICILWIEAYTVKEKKATWVAVYQAAPALGLITAYIVCALFV